MESLNLQCSNRLFPSPPGLCIKTRLSIQSLIRELFFILMRSKSHFHKKDCILGLILKVRVFELAYGLLKHFKDQPISKLLSHYSAVPEPVPTSQEQQTTSKPWTPTPPGIICNTSACTDISQGWCLKHFNFCTSISLFGSLSTVRANLHRCKLHEPEWNEIVL